MDSSNSTEPSSSMTAGTPDQRNGLDTGYIYLVVIGGLCGITATLVLVVLCLIIYVLTTVVAQRSSGNCPTCTRFQCDLCATTVVSQCKRVRQRRKVPGNSGTEAIVPEDGIQTDHCPPPTPCPATVLDNDAQIRYEASSVQETEASTTAAVNDTPTIHEDNSRVDSVIYEAPSNTGWGDTTSNDDAQMQTEAPSNKVHGNTISDDNDDSDEDIMYEMPSTRESQDRVDGNTIPDDKDDDLIYEAPSKQF